MQNVVLCTNKMRIANCFTDDPNLKSKYNLAYTTSYKDEVIPYMNESKQKIDVVMIVEGALSSTGMMTTTLLKDVRGRFPSVRIIYLAGEVDINDVSRINVLGDLVRNGIYDIYHQKKMSIAVLTDLLENPKKLEDVEYLTKYLEEETENRCYKNVVMVSSIKPGSGKSFLSVNLAAAIAKYGKNTYDGRRPKVAIVEGDLQTLSVGTLLHVENPRRNIREALRSISRIIDDEGYILGDDEEIEQVEKEVRSCFVKHDNIDNLFVLAGSQLSLNDLNIINSHHYYFLIQSIVNYFDVIIVDTNSSLEHTTTGPLLELADHCYYLLDLDSNNIRNNMRYWKELQMLGVTDKIYYVLNRDLPVEKQDKYAERLSYSSKDVEDAGFNIIEKIPMFDMSVAYNRNYRGTPIVLDSDPKVKDVRQALLNIANTTWEIDLSRVDMLKGNATVEKKEKKKGFFARIFGL